MKLLTGGEAAWQPARERLHIPLDVQGQQIWCKSRADGYSPDERRCRTVPRFFTVRLAVFVFPLKRLLQTFVERFK